MRIDAIDLYFTKNQLLNPWKTAYGSDTDTYVTFVKMTSGSDVGWSEASPLYAPAYSPEWGYGVYLVIRDFLAPLLIGKDFDDPKEIGDAFRHIKGNPFAKSGPEIAFWTLKSKRTGVPLHKMLGGEYKEVEVGADFGVLDSVETLIRLIDVAVKRGYPRTKLKVMRGWDLDMLKAVRSHFPNHRFHIDCNSGYTLDDLPLFKEIDKLGLEMIEQPLMDWDIIDHAKLQKALDTPVCLDESIKSPDIARQAIEIGACKYINIKMGRVGGLCNSKAINDMCLDAGVGCWIGGMLDTAVGTGISVEMATMSAMRYPSDIFPPHYYYDEDITEEKIAYSSPGKIMPKNIPGAPYTPDIEILSERTIESSHH